MSSKEIKTIGFVKSVRVKDGQIIATIQTEDDRFPSLLTAYIGTLLSTNLRLSPEAKRQLVLELPNTPVIDRRDSAE